MKILDLSNGHCKDEIDKALAMADFDKLLIFGNYVDPIKDEVDVVEDLRSLFQLRYKKPNLVKLLIGPEDVQYLFPWDRTFRTPSYRTDIADRITTIFNVNNDALDVAFQQDNFIFTYGGINNGWVFAFKDMIKKTASIGEQLIQSEVALDDVLNSMFLDNAMQMSLLKKDRSLEISTNVNNPYIYPGPIFGTYHSMQQIGVLANYHQVVACQPEGKHRYSKRNFQEGRFFPDRSVTFCSDELNMTVNSRLIDTDSEKK